MLQSDAVDIAVIGEECHITAARPQGARYAPSLSSEERDAYENLILLCSNHHKLIDDDRASFTPEVLLRLKTDHEDWIARRLSSQHPQITAHLSDPTAGVVNHVLRVLTRDRFSAGDLERSRGGWSQSYASTYLATAFREGNRPAVLATTDSVTITGQVVRALWLLREWAAAKPILSRVQTKTLQRLLSDTYMYLQNHYVDGRGGLFRIDSQGEPHFLPDFRHSASLARALATFAQTPREQLAHLLHYVLDCSRSGNFDDRVTTHVEIVAALPVAERILPQDRSVIADTRQRHISALARHFRQVGTSDASGGLFFDTKAAECMAPFYTCQVLSACGAELSHSGQPHVQSSYKQALMGLVDLEFKVDAFESAFPLTLDGPPDVAATALIACVLARSETADHRLLQIRCWRFVVRALAQREAVAWPWALYGVLELAAAIGDDVHLPPTI